MKKFKKFMSEEGISMVQVMIAAAAVGGLALVLARMGLISTKLQRTASNAVELHQVTNLIQKFMLNNRACTRTLQSNNFTGPNPATVIPEGGTRNLTAIYDFSQPTERQFLVVDDDSLGGRYFISNIQIRRGDSTAPDTDHDFDPSEIRMDITFQLKNDGFDSGGNRVKRQSFSGSEIIKQVVINARFSGTTNEVSECYSTMGDIITDALSAVCEDFHGGDPNGYVPATGECTGATGFQDFETYSANNNATTTTPLARPFTYCALTRAGGEDEWKSSSTHGCEVTQVTGQPTQWRLKSTKDEARSNYCRMICFRL